jgi:hypothetical protein
MQPALVNKDGPIGHFAKMKQKMISKSPSPFNIVCRPTSHYHFQFVGIYYFLSIVELGVINMKLGL